MRAIKNKPATSRTPCFNLKKVRKPNRKLQILKESPGTNIIKKIIRECNEHLFNRHGCALLQSKTCRGEA